MRYAGALRLERELDELILKVYKLTSDEIALLHRTAPLTADRPGGEPRSR